MMINKQKTKDEHFKYLTSMEDLIDKKRYYTLMKVKRGCSKPRYIRVTPNHILNMLRVPRTVNDLSDQLYRSITFGYLSAMEKSYSSYTQER